MGFNSENLGSAIVLDIETYRLADGASFLEDVQPPANYKDPDKIAAYVAEAREKALSRLALDADLCCIVAIGTWRQGEESPRIDLSAVVEDEANMLRRFWTAVGRSDTFIGYNLLSFDLPVLIRRSQYLGVAHPNVNLDRYRTPHIDLMERLSFNGKLKYRGLSFYAKRFGLDVPDDPTSGKDMDALVTAGDWAGVAHHCKCDVETTARLAERLGYLRTGVAA